MQFPTWSDICRHLPSHIFPSPAIASIRRASTNVWHVDGISSVGPRLFATHTEKYGRSGRRTNWKPTLLQMKSLSCFRVKVWVESRGTLAGSYRSPGVSYGFLDWQKLDKLAFRYATIFRDLSKKLYKESQNWVPLRKFNNPA